MSKIILDDMYLQGFDSNSNVLQPSLINKEQLQNYQFEIFCR